MTVALLSLLATNLAAQEVSEVADRRAKAEDFIIFPWGRMPTSNFSTGAWGDINSPDGLLKDLFDCGYNTTGFIPAEYVRYAASHRLAVILYDRSVASCPETTPQQAEETVKAALNKIEPPELRKAVYSVYIRDEPGASLFPRLRLWADAVSKQGFLPYINLFPGGVGVCKLCETKDYETYIDEYMNTCRMKYISYDRYAFYDDGRMDEDRFYGNLEIIREKSLQYGVLFWNVILSNAHYHYADPSPATLALQVYSTLAYGGRGIGYYTHYAPQHGDYRLAPVDQFGYRTKTWEMIRNINLQIHALSPVYCTLKNVNVFHTGNVPHRAHGIDSAVHLQSVSEGNLLVGEFVDPDNRPYLLIVNKNIEKSVNLNVSFKKEGKMFIVSPYGLGKIPFGSDWLAPGAGVLLTVE
jgi:hypothetical protein